MLYGTGVYLAPLHACLPIVQDVIAALRPYRGATPEVERKRCLGVAVEVALALIRGEALSTTEPPCSSSRAQEHGWSERACCWPRHTCVESALVKCSDRRPFIFRSEADHGVHVFWRLAGRSGPAKSHFPSPLAFQSLFPSAGPASDVVRSTRGQPGGNGRILVCAAGPVTEGPGSIPAHEAHPAFQYELQRAAQHMAGLGRQAKQLEVAIDVLAAGTCPVRVPVLLPLAEASGGVLLLLADGFEATFAENVRRALLRGSGSRGSLCVRCSPPLQLARVIGPAEAPSETPEAAGPSGEGLLRASCRGQGQ